MFKSRFESNAVFTANNAEIKNKRFAFGHLLVKRGSHKLEIIPDLRLSSSFALNRSNI